MANAITILMTAVFALALTIPAPNLNASELLPLEDLTPGRMAGFGDSWNRYAWSMVSDNGSLYVGTWNQDLQLSRFIAGVLLSLPEINLSNLNNYFQQLLGKYPVNRSRGGEIWRYRLDDGAWTNVVEGGYEDQFNTGFRIAAAYRGRLYFGSANYENGAQVIALSDNGTSVAVIEPDEEPLHSRWYANDSNRAMAVYNGLLYIGKENPEGAELWQYDGSTLKPVWAFRELSIGQLCVYGDYLFAGMWDLKAGMKLYRLQIDGDATVLTLDDITPSVFDGSNDTAVTTLAVFDGRLFVGTANYREGCSVFCITSPDAPPGDQRFIELLIQGGFGNPLNMYAWSMEVFDGRLLIGTFNIFGPQLWSTRNGSDWQAELLHGTGTRHEWGFRTMSVTDDRLFIGTASSVPSTLLPGPPGGLKVFATPR